IVMMSRPRTRIPSRPRLGACQIGNQSQGYREPGSYTRVTTRPSSSSEFPIALVTALPGIRR
ncbi:hypothetical protein Tco_0384113, partial [Tanacetum coccineum]